MTTTVLKRVFEITRDGEKIKIADPNPNYSIAEVSDFLSEQYPELSNASFSEPKTEGDTLIYEVKKTFGTKG